MANKLIFRRLTAAREQLEATLRRKCLLDEDDALEREQLLALREIYDYIAHDETWVSQAKSRRKAITFLKNHCNYEKTREELHAKSRNSVEVSMSYLAKKLETKIGTSTIDLILEGKVQEAMVQFRTGTGHLNPREYLIEGLFDLLPSPINTPISFIACEKEIKFLLIFGKNHLVELASKYSQDHLAYLVYILTSTDRVVADERRILYQLLKGEFNNKEQAGAIGINEQIDKAFKEYARFILRN